MASENLVVIGPGNRLSGRHPVFTRNNDDLLSIGPLETQLCDIQIKMQQFSSKKNWIWKCRLQNGGIFFSQQRCVNRRTHAGTKANELNIDRIRGRHLL